MKAHYQKYPCAENDPANFYIRYSYRFTPNYYDVASPFPTETQIIVSTDSIVYNRDATLCVAFISIECNFDKINGLVQEYDSIRKYDALAVVGYRPTIKDTIDIYPLTNYSEGKCKSREDAIKFMVDHYSHYLSHWHFGEKEETPTDFCYNMGEEGFFDDYIFKQYDDSTYGFQLYRHWDKYNRCRYNYMY